MNDRTGVAAQNSRHATASLPADDIDELVVFNAVGVHAGAHLEVCWLMYFQTLFTRLPGLRPSPTRHAFGCAG